MTVTEEEEAFERLTRLAEGLVLIATESAADRDYTPRPEDLVGSPGCVYIVKIWGHAHPEMPLSFSEYAYSTLELAQGEWHGFVPDMVWDPRKRVPSRMFPRVWISSGQNPLEDDTITELRLDEDIGELDDIEEKED